jgi:Protein of unknown function (DUF3300)
MKTRAGVLLAHALVLPLCISTAFAQVTELGPADQAQPAPGQSEQEQPEQVFAQQELDQMLAPIALYPDSLLSQILMASTYPIEVVQAARWSKSNPGLTGDAAVRAVEQQNWDPSVKSLVAFPQVISMMDEKLDWMERLGDAFLSQQQQVMDTVQQLRQKAQAAGNLQSNDNVRVEPQGQTIVIEQANPQVVYVPYYDPTVIYGPWWYPAYPPVFWRPWPGYYAHPGFGAGFFWGSGITIGAGFFFGGFDWPHRHVSVVNVNNYYYRPPHRPPPGPPGGWYHDPGHRRGVPYRDPVLRREFARPSARPGAMPEARRDFRGHDAQRVQAQDPRPDMRNGPDNRPAQQGNRPDRDNRADQRDRMQQRPEVNGRPNAAEAGRLEAPGVPRANAPSVPAPNAPSVPRANAPSVPRPNAPSIPRPNDGNLPRPNLPNVAGTQPRAVPNLPAAPEPRPHIFDGVGQGPVVRDSSQRGHESSQRIAPVRPAAQPQVSAPVARPQAGPAVRPAPQQRPSGGEERRGGNEGQQRQQR